MGYLGTKPNVATALPDNIVTADKIAANAVITSKIADDAVNAAKIASNSVGTSELINSAVTGSKLVTAEEWTATSSLGNTFFWTRTAIGNNLFLWRIRGDSYYAGTYLNMPSGTGSGGAVLAAWNAGQVLYAECMRTRLYGWHGGEQQRAFSGFTYDGSLNITRFNHSMPQIDAWFAGIMITRDQ